MIQETNCNLIKKEGATFANVYNEQGKDFVAQGKFGLAADGFLSIPLTKFIGSQPQVMYFQKEHK